MSVSLIDGHIDRDKQTMNCKYYYDEICVNADCPYRADYCPVTEFPEVCKYFEKEGADNDN